jgi:hypothetical protein
MQIYEEPKLLIVSITECDIVCTSGFSPDPDSGTTEDNYDWI